MRLVNLLGTKLSANGLDTKLIIYDHNWDNLDYASNILASDNVSELVDGTAFHCYGGDFKVSGRHFMLCN